MLAAGRKIGHKKGTSSIYCKDSGAFNRSAVVAALLAAGVCGLRNVGPLAQAEAQADWSGSEDEDLSGDS